MRKQKLGEILVSRGAVTDADIDAALSDQSAGEPSRLGDLLVATGKLSSAELAQALAQQHSVPYVELPLLPRAVIDLVPLELQRRFRFVPLKSDGTELHIAMADLADREVVQTLEQTWSVVHVCVASGEEIDALHNTLSGIFALPPELQVAPRRGSVDALFEELDAELEGPPRVAGSPVPMIAPVADGDAAVRGPNVEDLFGDLNLEVSGKLPISVSQAAKAPQPLPPPVPFDEAPEPILEEIVENGTGPVIDTPFFSNTKGRLVEPLADVPFSSPSQLQQLAIAPPPAQPAPVAPVNPPVPSAPGQPLPEWLSGGAPPTERPASLTTPAWTGALEHLAPSTLVVGLTKALLARGLVTEAEILGALGQKK